MTRSRKPKVPRLEAASTAVDNATLSEATNDDDVLGSPHVTRSSKLKATKGLPGSYNPSGGIVIKENVPVETSDKGKQIVGTSGTVSTGVFIKENVPVEASDKGKEIVGTSGSLPGSDLLTIEEKIDFLVESVQEIKAKGIKQLPVNEDQPLEFDFKAQYLKSQKQVDALTKKNHDLSTKLASALAKLEAYEKMNALGQMNEAMTTANLSKATEAFMTFTSQLTSGSGGPLIKPLLQGPSGEGTSTNPPVAAQQTGSLPQATATDQGTSAEPETWRRSKRQIKKKGG